MTRDSKHPDASCWVNEMRRLLRRGRVKLQALRYRRLSPQETFERIYASRAWGTGGGNPFDSGTGSTDQFTRAYVDTITAYSEDRRLSTIVDLGCGDFRVGSHLIKSANVDYIGVDVVRPLIEHHNKAFSDSRTRFLCLDIISDPLPAGDLYLIRQVLQHLSNAQITKILHKLASQHVIVTEHIPVGQPVHPNRDKATGPDIRLYSCSGVYLEFPPFNRQLETLLEVPAPFNGRAAIIRTSLLRPQEV
jgi:SAM-dependent methyltransferase